MEIAFKKSAIQRKRIQLFILTLNNKCICSSSSFLAFKVSWRILRTLENKHKICFQSMIIDSCWLHLNSSRNWPEFCLPVGIPSFVVNSAGFNCIFCLTFRLKETMWSVFEKLWIILHWIADNIRFFRLYSSITFAVPQIIITKSRSSILCQEFREWKTKDRRAKEIMGIISGDLP